MNEGCSSSPQKNGGKGKWNDWDCAKDKGGGKNSDESRAPGKGGVITKRTVKTTRVLPGEVEKKEGGQQEKKPIGASREKTKGVRENRRKQRVVQWRCASVEQSQKKTT